MTPDELRAIEARTEAATPGEWRLRQAGGVWWAVEVELPSINGLRCWYTIARFDFDMAANGYTDGALRPEADATLLAHARQDIPRLAAALREAWDDNARLSAEGVDKARAWDKLQAAQSRALAAEADCQRLQDEVANIDAARREAEAAAAEMREALASAVRIADEARREWDRAPSGMRAGKILIALSGGIPGYRPDTDAGRARGGPRRRRGAGRDAGADGARDQAAREETR